MTTRIDRRFAALQKDGRAALVTFTMAGDPDYDTSVAILKALPKAGADVIELGMPFTDPMADGPAIQAAGLRALKAGQNMKKTLALVREFRAGDDATPIVLMGYYNPIYIYGVERFFADAKSGRRRRPHRGRSAAEEDAELCLPAMQAGLQFHPPGDADDRRQAAAGRAREHVGLRLLRLDHRHYRRRGAGSGKVADAVTRIKRHTKFRSASASACAPPSRRAPRARRRRRRCRFRAGGRRAQESRRRRQADVDNCCCGYRSRTRVGRRFAERASRDCGSRELATVPPQALPPQRIFCMTPTRSMRRRFAAMMPFTAA